MECAAPWLVSRSTLHRPEILIEPLQRLFHHHRPRQEMAAVEHDLLLRRGAKQSHEWLLRFLIGKRAIVPAAQHEDGNANVRQEIHLVFFGAVFVGSQASHIECRGADTRLDGEERSGEA